MINEHYYFKLDYDVVASYSLMALRGRANGWCDPRLISQIPLIYGLYTSGFSTIFNSGNSGQKIGTFELRKRPLGECEIIFCSPGLLESKLLELEKPEIEKRERLELLDKHLLNVMTVYFQLLASEGITPGSPSDTEHKTAMNTEIDKFADLWENREYTRMKGYNQTQWLSDNNAPAWITAKALQRYIKKRKER